MMGRVLLVTMAAVIGALVALYWPKFGGDGIGADPSMAAPAASVGSERLAIWAAAPVARAEPLTVDRNQLPWSGDPYIPADELSVYALDRRSNDGLRNEALNAIRTKGVTTLAVKTCISILIDDRETPRLRSFAAQHLGTLLPSCDEDLRCSIYDALTPLVRSEVAPLPIRQDALLALGRDPSAAHIGPVREVLVDTLAKGDRRLVSIALRIAQECRWNDLAPFAERYRTDEDRVIRDDAVSFLEGISSP